MERLLAEERERDRQSPGARRRIARAETSHLLQSLTGKYQNCFLSIFILFLNQVLMRTHFALFTFLVLPSPHNTHTHTHTM